jgi:hypothetical protein
VQCLKRLRLVRVGVLSASLRPIFAALCFASDRHGMLPARKITFHGCKCSELGIVHHGKYWNSIKMAAFWDVSPCGLVAAD